MGVRRVKVEERHHHKRSKDDIDDIGDIGRGADTAAKHQIHIRNAQIGGLRRTTLCDEQFD